MIPLDIRIKYNIFQKNPMLNDIKNNYSLSFLLASESVAILKDYYNKDISEEIIKEAERKSEELKKNTITDVRMAGEQSISALKQRIKDLVTAKVLEEGLKGAVADT
ncbi:PRD domain-containing protein, partial [Brachyspira hyodysenteriae]|uniref:PRD domain-containing protein n=1 Tax=Brachyspira hyodysenteriae TaxID=159 RepID=UPI001177F81D